MTFLLFEGRQTEKEDDLQILRDAVKEINRDDLERKIQRHFATGKKNEKCEIKKYLIFNASFLYLFGCCCCFVLFVFLAGGGRGGGRRKGAGISSCSFVQSSSTVKY